ncbi:MAG: carboxypeptidase regulatory-like domain-containing protein [Planctomycetes bacterium]|nr:carboxypeptidase regulatory-like domain-containing protein [Planctomycetota bacterium]
MEGAEPLSMELEPAHASLPGSSVSARFVDVHGAPIAQVELRVAHHSEVTARSGPDGVAELRLDPDSRARLPGTVVFEARGLGFARDQRSATVRLNERLLLGDWVLVLGGSVSGWVVDVDGRGVTEAQVACLREGLETDWQARRRDTLAGLARPGARALIEPDGSFLLEDVPAGSIRLVAVCEERPAGVSEPLDVPAGELVGDVTIVMGAADGGTSIAGLVLDPDGRVVPYAEVRIASEGTSYSISAGENGRFRVQLGHEKPCEVTAFDPERSHREATLQGIAPGTTDLVLRLVPAPEFELLVLSREGAPIERYAVATISARTSEVLAMQLEAERSEGRCAVSVPAQQFSVEVRANGWMAVRLGPFSAETPPPRLECRLAPAGGVHGVVEAEGSPVPGAWVALYEELGTRETYNGFPLRTSKEPALESESDTDGRFSLSVERAGTYYLRAEVEGYACAELGPLALTPDGLREERIELGRGGSIAVSVRSSSGALIEAVGKLVAISRGDGFARTQRTDEAGRTIFVGLTPGSWQVALSESEIDPREGALYSSTKTAGPIPSNCRVFEQETTHLDLLLEQELEGECQLTGRLEIDGRPAEGWLAALDQERETLHEPRGLSEPGFFRLAVDEPGSYRLNLRTDTADPGAMLVILDPVELVAGNQFWSLEFDTGALEGTLPSSGAAEALVFYRWQRGALACLAPLVPDAEGRFRCVRVPAGRGALVRYDPTRPLEEQTPVVLRELVIEAGQTLTVSLAR